MRGWQIVHIARHFSSNVRNAKPMAFAALLVVLVLAPGCSPQSRPSVRLATTTSTQNSGLLEVLLPVFEEQTGVRVQLIAVGTGQALALGERGDVDVLLVHARKREDDFVAQGYGVDRRDVMWNDFVIVGPQRDPAGIRAMTDAVAALAKVAAAKAPFVSRGDDSGTHIRELDLWRQVAAGPPLGQGFYLSSGLGMGACLILADEKNGYCLTDRGTYLAYRDKLRLELLVAGDLRLRNPYGVIRVNPARHIGVREHEAQLLTDFLVSPKCQQLIRNYAVDGEVLFHPAAAKPAAPSSSGRLASPESRRQDGLLTDGIRQAAALLWDGDRSTLHAIWVSLLCTLSSVILAAVLAIPYGAWLGFYRPRARLELLVLRLGMSMPTVILGLLVYALLSRRGVLADADLLYTKSAIVAGEFLLAFPLLGTLAHGMARSLSPVVLETPLTFGASRWSALLLALGECRAALAAALLAAFGRCLTELGIAVTVGGNLATETRTLPGAIQLELSRGEFGRALAAGLVLLTLALIITVLGHWASGEAKR